MKKRGIFNILVLMVCAMIWGLAFSAQSVGAEYVGPWTFLAARAWIGVATLLVFIGIRKLVINKTDEGRRAYEDARAVRETADDETRGGRRLMLIAGASAGILLCLASVMQQAGIAYTTVAKSSFITAMYVVIVPVISMLSGKRPGAKIWLAVALSRGDLMTLGCAFLFAMQIICINHYADRLDGLVLSCSEFFFEAVAATVGMLVFEESSFAALIPAAGAMLYAGVMSNGIAYTLQIIGQRDFDPTIASLCMCMESVFGAIGGFILLGQTLTAREATGCILMFVAIVIAEIPVEIKKLKKILPEGRGASYK